MKACRILLTICSLTSFSLADAVWGPKDVPKLEKFVAHEQLPPDTLKMLQQHMRASYDFKKFPKHIQNDMLSHVARGKINFTEIYGINFEAGTYVTASSTLQYRVFRLKESNISPRLPHNDGQLRGKRLFPIAGALLEQMPAAEAGYFDLLSKQLSLAVKSCARLSPPDLRQISRGTFYGKVFDTDGTQFTPLPLFTQQKSALEKRVAETTGYYIRSLRELGQIPLNQHTTTNNISNSILGENLDKERAFSLPILMIISPPFVSESHLHNSVSLLEEQISFKVNTLEQLEQRMKQLCKKYKVNDTVNWRKETSLSPQQKLIAFWREQLADYSLSIRSHYNSFTTGQLASIAKKHTVKKPYWVKLKPL